MSSKDFRSDLEMWMDMWDQAQEEGLGDIAEKPKPISYPSPSQNARDDYYDYLDASDDYSDETLIQEERHTPNPVYPDSVGTDQEQPVPVWTEEDFVKEITKLKDRLFSVENQMARMGQGKGWTEKVVRDNGGKLMSEIQSIRKRIDNMSNVLGIKDEPSPWVIKKV